MIDVLTVDDQPVFRAAARDVIDATPGFRSAGEAQSGAEALQKIGAIRPELALVDVRMPGMDGAETARRLRALQPELVVVLISTEDAHNLPASVSNCGAAALIRKQDLRPAVLSELWAAAAPS
jgi:two-component system, NarL family, invasion response regulator UvrY